MPMGAVYESLVSIKSRYALLCLPLWRKMRLQLKMKTTVGYFDPVRCFKHLR